MSKIGIFFGSSGGVTRAVAEKLEELFDGAELIDMEEDFDDIDQMLEYDILLLGSSTWGQGDPQRDWVDPLYEIESDDVDFSGKTIALFGAGDQETHGEHFVSALGKMYDSSAHAVPSWSVLSRPTGLNTSFHWRKKTANLSVFPSMMSTSPT